MNDTTLDRPAGAFYYGVATTRVVRVLVRRDVAVVDGTTAAMWAGLSWERFGISGYSGVFVDRLYSDSNSRP